MKYLVIILVVVILVRIDVLMHGVDTIANKVQSRKESRIPDIEPNVQPSDDLISIKDDRSLVRTPRIEFFTLLEDFHLRPSSEIKDKMVEIFKKKPDLFGSKLDKQLEAEIFKLTDLIYNKNSDFAYLLVDLTENLKGENLEMIKRFFTIMMDSNLELFLKVYSRTKDSNCMIAKLMGHRFPAEELLNEFIERQELLDNFLSQEKIDPTIHLLAKSCQLVVNMEVNKLNPDNVSAPEETTTPAPAENPIPPTPETQVPTP
jgi:hypothetical protein